jgi:hypothetical protein
MTLAWLLLSYPMNKMALGTEFQRKLTITVLITSVAAMRKSSGLYVKPICDRHFKEVQKV